MIPKITRSFKTIGKGYGSDVVKWIGFGLSITALLCIMLGMGLYTRNPSALEDADFCPVHVLSNVTDGNLWCSSFLGNDKFLREGNTIEWHLIWGPSYGWDFSVLAALFIAVLMFMLALVDTSKLYHSEYESIDDGREGEEGDEYTAMY
eukprot:TRINITY_DN10290_c0_g1_i1.p1 TRINITY_DN10290_c0_g1~~TRINITY_DN10290_c0_g1_i1.p1  ORF type:complete len:149 (-),score=16.25 TRINITY_DN10290_c0_g1_i1:36-482(-)